MADIGYARVSTRDQDPHAQVIRLREAGCDRIFVDRATGRHLAREGLESVFEYARPGDRIVVVRLDRLGRSVRDLLTVAERLRNEQLEIVSLTEAIDTTTPHGVMLFTVLGALAQFESELRRERQEDAWAAGARKGRPPALGREQIEWAQSMRTDGKSLAVIAGILRVSPRTVGRHTRG